MTFTKFERGLKIVVDMCIYIYENDYLRIVENDGKLWPEGVYVRDYVPYDSYQRDSQWSHS